MMTFCGHIGAALITAGLLKLNPVLTIIGAVLPDLDILMCLTGRHWYDYHRKLTHSLLFLLAFIIPAFFYGFMTPISFGILSHLIIDSISYPGIMLLYPFSRKKFYILKSKQSKKFKEDTPIIAIKNWLYNTKEILIESVILMIGLIILFI